MKTNIFWSFLLLLGMLSIFSCQKDSDDLPVIEDEMEETEITEDEDEEIENDDSDQTRELEEGEKVISIRLTDAPIDLQAVNVDIVGMYIVAGDMRHQLSTAQGVYNLLDFQDGIDTLISVDTFSISFLNDIVFELGDNNSVIDNAGIEHPLELPSANRNFLTISFNQRLDSLQLVDLQLDFDACRSIHETDSGRWILRPVIHVATFNDRPVDSDTDFGGNKIDMIKSLYPDFDDFEIERKQYCFTDELVIRVDMSSPNEEQTVLLDASCARLYKVQKQEITNVPDNIVDSAMDVLTGGDVDLFREVEAYAGVNGDVAYGFRAIKGQGNSGQEWSLYIDESGMLICRE